MSKKVLLILALIVVVLAAIIGGVRWRKGRGEKSGNANNMSKALQNMDPSQVGEIEIKKDESVIALARQDGAWRVDGKRADAELVQKALDTLRTSAYEGPISRNPENFERLGVGDEGLLISLRVEDTRIAFRVGKSGPTYSSSYVKIEGKDEVYLANANLSLVFPLLIDSWRNKTIVNIDPAALDTITYRMQGATIKTYHKDGDTWEVSAGAATVAAGNAEMETLIAALHPLKATGFIDTEKDKATFAQKEAKGIIISFKGSLEADSGEVTLVKQQNVWWIRAAGEDEIFTLSDSFAKSLAIP
ncbi:MAG: DUF4340 domain-containing protein [Patescibacteria group bacterium]